MVIDDLFKVLTLVAHCEYESDLKFLGASERAILADYLTKHISDYDYPVEQWNDLLKYIFSMPGCKNSAEARETVIAILKKK